MFQHSGNTTRDPAKPESHVSAKSTIPCKKQCENLPANEPVGKVLLGNGKHDRSYYMGVVKSCHHVENEMGEKVGNDMESQGCVGS